ncbi:tyrosine-type recombinase/integrase [Anaerobacillus sp. MEB173]|uniref:tyrosine-type recombinase/integrase n=1 Tax=Anaerobacillus sp. MEB173 TaxID=3383345 RepID=UPI003F8F0E97
MKKKCAGATEVLESFAQDLLQRGRSENTVKTYVGVLHSFASWLIEEKQVQLDQVTKEDIQSYMDYLDHEGRSATTIDKIFNTLGAFARYLDRPQIMKEVHRKEKTSDYTPPEYLSDKEIKQLLHRLENDENNRNIAIAYTLLYTGIRVSELCALNKEDLQNGLLIIRSRDKERNRQIPVSKVTIEYINKYLDSRIDDQEALFLSNYQKRISTRTVQHMLKQYGVHPHKLRHTFCYELVNKGVDLTLIAELAGHSDINITKQYAKSSKRSQLEDAINKMYA